jgi:hypothetical protein
MLYKIVEREPINNRVIQIHEVHWTSVGDKVQEIVNTGLHTLTVTPLR